MKVLSISEDWLWATTRCAQSEQCSYDISQKLIKRGLSPGQANALAKRLEAEGYINEQRYARAFTHDKLLYDRWGRQKISAALRAKHLSANPIAMALAEIDPTEYEATLASLLKSKAPHIEAENDYLRRQKLARFAAGRGFELPLVFKLLDLEESDDDEPYDETF